MRFFDSADNSNNEEDEIQDIKDSDLVADFMKTEGDPEKVAALKASKNLSQQQTDALAVSYEIAKLLELWHKRSDKPLSEMTPEEAKALMLEIVNAFVDIPERQVGYVLYLLTQYAYEYMRNKAN